jgi:tryptophan synthase beta chain
MAPLVSQLIMDGLIEPRAIPQLETFSAGVTWARNEGFISAPETNHALAALFQEAKKAKEEGKEKTILVNWSGHGLVDLAAYDAFFQGKLFDYELPQDNIDAALKAIEAFPKPNV